jgi:hypothetical protein
VCPYYLDGDLAQHDPKVLQGPVIPVFSRRLSMAADVASVQFSRTVERRVRRPAFASCGHAIDWTCPTTSGGRRSLKTQQHAGVVATGAGCAPQVVKGDARATIIQPGSVDMLGPIRLVIAGPRTHCWAQAGSATARVHLAMGPGSGHR